MDNKMVTAQEARRITNNYQDPKLEELFREIRAEAETGGDHIFEYTVITPKTKETLERLGFTIKVIETFRDTSWKISW